MLAGGIDLGGTKIDARLFDPEAGWALADAREVATPRGTYAELLDAVAGQVRWLDGAGAATIGLGAPGIVHADGTMLTANLPATGMRLPEDLAAACGRRVAVFNDCRAFAYSEARLGAGRGARSVLGLVIGTGIAGGLVLDGRLVDGPNGQAGEYGHVPASHRALARHGLPLVECGCGGTGCFETLCSGPGIARIAKAVCGREIPAHGLAEAGDDAARILDMWADLASDLLLVLCLNLDPEVVVLGGGVSGMEGIEGILGRALEPKLLPGTRAPRIALAEGGQRSGARGAALMARDADGAGS